MMWNLAFYDRLELQLREIYGIDYKAPDPSGVVDHKRAIKAAGTHKR